MKRLLLVFWMFCLPNIVYAEIPRKRLLVDETSRLDALERKMEEKEKRISQLEADVNQLEQDRNYHLNLINALTLKVNTKKPGCQTGAHTFGDPNGHANGASSAIHFNPPFEETPKVVWGTTWLDLDHNHNIRVATSANSITKTGFTIEGHTWADTGVYQISVVWMACPANL